MPTSQNDGKPVIDIYARLSYAEDGEAIRVEDQVELCADKVADRGGVVGKVWKDPAKSAWNPKVVRPEWNKLMERLESGSTDGVIVYDLTRFSRKVIEGERLLEAAQRGLRVWALSGEYDLATADGRKHFRDAMVSAAGESDKISERSRRGKLRRARRGRVANPGQAGYAFPRMLPRPEGWQPGDPRPMVPEQQVEAEREIVRECCRRLLAGDSIASVVRDLNTRNVRGPNAPMWSRTALRQVILRPTLAGLAVHQGKIVGELVDVDPVLDREDWERACSIMAARKRGRPAGRAHLLSGLMRCGMCGFPMYGAPRNNMAPYPDGETYREYRCRRHETGNSGPGCGRNFIDARVAEQAVGEAVKERLSDPRRADRIAKRLATSQADRQRIEAELARLNADADELATKTLRWGSERVEKALDPILRRIEELRGKLVKIDLPEQPSVAAAEVAAEWDRAVTDGDHETLRSLVRRAFPKLTVKPRAQHGDHSPYRLDWDGRTLQN